MEQPSRGPASGVAPMTVRPLSTRDLDQASVLAMQVFTAYVAGSCEPEGLAVFAACVTPEALGETITRGALALGAFAGRDMVGMLVVRKPGHVANFFVDTRRHRQGVGRALFEEALARLRQPDGGEPAVTVNASLNSIRFYEGQGFSRTGNEVVKDGLRFAPMRRPARP
jgi:GNAT superfamily N-acetyltransferase